MHPSRQSHSDVATGAVEAVTDATRGMRNEFRTGKVCLTKACCAVRWR